MRSKVVRTLALALVLSGASISLAQTSPSGGRKPPESSKSQGANAPRSGEKSKLEEMLAEALKNNPDIRVAAAKLAEAEAELTRTRLQVTQKVVMLHYAIETQKKTVAIQEDKCKQMEKAYQSGSAPTELLSEAKQALALAKAKLEELEAQMPALLGKERPTATADLEAHVTQARVYETVKGGTLFFSRETTVNIPQAEKTRKALQTPVKVDYKDINFDTILKDLAKKVPGLSFRNLFSAADSAQTMNLRFEEALPVSAILQALADEFGCLFFVREYGIVATEKSGAPHGAMTVEEFLRHKPADESRPQSRGGKNPPAENVEGLVKNVDASGLMTLTIGSDAGLAKGHTLELFRLNPSAPSQSMYLGTVRILEADARQAVAQPVGRLAATPQRGDRVASRLLGG